MVRLDGATQAHLPARQHARPPTTNPRVQAENLAPHVVAALARQLRQLATAPPDGITFVPSEVLNEIFADIDGPSTLLCRELNVATSAADVHHHHHQRSTHSLPQPCSWHAV